ncbi:MAG: oxidoreductase [Mycobacteriales bacterium]
MTFSSDRWTAADITDQNGRTALVTGANSGLGFQTAVQLAEHGAHVLLGVRDIPRGEQALARLTKAVPGAAAELVALDLADQASIRAAADDVSQRVEKLDILVNNAGVMATPYRRTVDGFEQQLGTNHLGHFALTGLLLPSLLAAPAPRVVTVSSLAHAAGVIDFDDLQSERSYNPMTAYAQSKLANLLFAGELDRRAQASGSHLVSVAAHPGVAATNLMRGRPGEGGRIRGLLFGLGFRIAGQSDARGAWSQLYAATAPDVAGGQYVGPGLFGEWRGSPVQVDRSAAAKDLSYGTWLWEVSEQLTGVSFDLPVSTV